MLDLLNCEDRRCTKSIPNGPGELGQFTVILLRRGDRIRCPRIVARVEQVLQIERCHAERWWTYVGKFRKRLRRGEDPQRPLLRHLIVPIRVVQRSRDPGHPIPNRHIRRELPGPQHADPFPRTLLIVLEHPAEGQCCEHLLAHHVELVRGRVSFRRADPPRVTHGHPHPLQRLQILRCGPSVVLPRVHLHRRRQRIVGGTHRHRAQHDLRETVVFLYRSLDGHPVARIRKRSVHGSRPVHEESVRSSDVTVSCRVLHKEPVRQPPGHDAGGAHLPPVHPRGHPVALDLEDLDGPYSVRSALRGAGAYEMQPQQNAENRPNKRRGDAVTRRSEAGKKR